MLRARRAIRRSTQLFCEAVAESDETLNDLVIVCRDFHVMHITILIVNNDRLSFQAGEG